MKIDKTIWNFYWDGKVEKIKRNTIIDPRDKGGTGLLHVECKLMSVKVQWFSNYIKSQGKWKQFFNYWITKASDKSNLSWYVLSNSHKPVNTTPFYQDLIYAFKAVNGKINCSFSVCSETKEVPLWHNVCATDDDTELNSPLLVYNNFNKVKDIIDNGSLISFRKVAKKCNISNIIAGRLVARIDNHINHNLIEEKRVGPSNHICNWLVIFDKQADDYIDVSHITVKINYRNLILSRFTVPNIQVKWQEILHFRPNLDWSSIWKNGLNNFIMDPEDKDFWYKLKHRSLPTKVFLSKIGTINDNICPLCNVEPETHEHLFIYCTHTLNAWLFVEHILNKYSGNKLF